MIYNELEIIEVEKILLPEGCRFSKEALEFLNCTQSKEVLACPGSGKTTLLMAKLYLLSKDMPFENNKGICVLSHTNVAVEEIKTKLGSAAAKILAYPNFVGTIQSFVDKFIVFPYLTNLTNATIQVVDEHDYVRYFWNLCCYNKKYSKLKWLIENNVEKNHKYDNPESYIADLYICKDGKMKCKNIDRCVSGEDKPSTLLFKDLKLDLLVKNGLIMYQDAYDISNSAMNEYGEELKNLLSMRFNYTFIDEYQDCNFDQVNVLDKLFLSTTLQKIGDVDQAIYGGIYVKDTPWVVSDNVIMLSGSNRYNQKIADVLTKLRQNKEPIISLNQSCTIKPTLIVFKPEQIKLVIPEFKKQIEDKGLNNDFPLGKYKIIGMIKRGTGIKISDYIGDSNHAVLQSGDGNIYFYIAEIKAHLNCGDLHQVGLTLRRMLLKICKVLNLVDNNGHIFNLHSIKNEINSDNEYKTKYIDLVLLLATLEEYKNEEIYNVLVEFISCLFENYVSNLKEFLESQENDNIFENSCLHNELETTIETVHKVKGETHIATLYLETETSRSSDVKRILPLLAGKTPDRWTNIHEKSRKIVYVGLSRPSKFLCLAIQDKTFAGNEKLFKDWDIIDLQ